jgi:hypothetical protein
MNYGAKLDEILGAAMNKPAFPETFAALLQTLPFVFSSS